MLINKKYDALIKDSTSIKIDIQIDILVNYCQQQQ